MVNRSTYYKFLNHTPSARDKDNAYIRSCILAKSCRSFFYLCVILDLFSRKVIAYKLSRKNDSKLALDTVVVQFEYIHGFYNSVRPHSHNNGLSPNQAELAFS